MKKNQVDNPHLFKVPKVRIVRGRIEFVLERCKDKRVLHLGCVDEGLTAERIKSGMLMHLQLSKIAKEVYGVDISEKGIKLLQEEGIGNLILGDVEHLDSVKELQGKTFDIILASEVIEHLNNPGFFLQSVQTLFSPNTEMILTAPNAFRLSGMSYSFKGYEFVHPDHNYWFSWKTLSTLLVKNGYVINEILAYSFEDWKVPTIKSVWKKIPNRKENQKSSEVIQKEASKKLLPWFGSRIKKVIRFVKEATCAVVRNYLYSRNPFFADGFIFILKPGCLK